MIYGFSLLSLVSSGFESQSDVPRSGFHEDLHAAMLPLQGRLSAAVISRRASLSFQRNAYCRGLKNQTCLYIILVFWPWPYCCGFR